MATIAVFLGLGGGAYAALTLPKNSIGPKQIKKNAVRSGEVKNNALTGRDVSERTLGVVPNASRAANADHAANADLLAGNGPGAFASADRLTVSRAAVQWVSDGTETGARSTPLLTKGPFTITLDCRYAANTQATLLVTTTAARSSVTGGAGTGTVFGPASAAQQLVFAKVPPSDPSSDDATAGSPFSLWSPPDGIYMAGQVAVFATDTGNQCRGVVAAVSG
jgi:hypothetical protein